MAKSCGGRFLGIAVRGANLIVMLIGLTLAGYAVKMFIDKNSAVLSGSVLGLGVVDAALGLLLLTCGYSSLFFLRLYAFIVGLLELGQIAVAILFLTPSTRDNLIDTIAPPADLRSAILNNLTVAGYVMIAVVAFQAVTLALVLVQSCSLDTGFDESAYDQESLLGGKKGARSGGGGDRFGALDDEVAASAASRYREKAGKFYSKYGVK